ncbi:MAG: sodium:solute symporter family protein [Vulcanimicrobiaceae bacterium]
MQIGSVSVILGVVIVGVVLVTWVGIQGGAGASKTFEGWALNSRLMGTVLVWFLLGTEIYTAFTFLGLAGFAYARGGGVFYNVGTNNVGYALGFFILPAIWLLGKRFSYVTQSDFIAGRYQSRGLGIFVAICTAIIMIAYIDLNIEGLGAILHITMGGLINLTQSEVIGFAVLAVSVFFGGIRGNAWQSVIKDILMFIAIGALFFVVPLRFFGGFGPMFHRLATEIPQRITMPGPHKLGEGWFITTALLTGLGMWMWPQWFSVAFTARSPRTLKLQAVFMPFYQLVKVAVIGIGFAAIIIFAGEKVAGNNVVMTLAVRAFPTWFLAIFTLAAVLSALIPAGPIIVTSCTLLARNLYAQFRPSATQPDILRISRLLVFPVTAAALYLAIVAPALIVVVLLVAYDFIAQLVPAVVIGGIFWRRATLPGALSGIIVGWVLSAFLLITKHDPIFGLNAGFVALCANAVVFFVVSLLTKPVDSAFLDNFFETLSPGKSPASKVPVGTRASTSPTQS